MELTRTLWTAVARHDAEVFAMRARNYGLSVDEALKALVRDFNAGERKVKPRARPTGIDYRQEVARAG